jgi:FdhD protein
MSAATIPRNVLAVAGAHREARSERVAVEEPLEIRLLREGEPGEGRVVSVTMRTPGNDAELAAGFLYGEGVVHARDELTSLVHTGDTGNVIHVVLSRACDPALARLERHSYTSSSCGVCGKTSIEAVMSLVRPGLQPAGFGLDAAVLPQLPARARSAQRLYGETGGVHAATLFDAQGRLVAQYEDVGRHNALDKLVGERLMAGALPASRHILLLSGRASFELIQKALVAGIPAVAAIGAPSSLAVELAESTGIMLAGFLRPDSFNVYTHPERLQ